MTRLGIAEMNKIALGSLVALALICLAFVLKTAIETLAKPAPEIEAGNPAMPGPPSPEHQAQNMPPPAPRAGDQPASHPSGAVTRPADEMDRIIESRETHRIQVRSLRANAREKSDDPKALSAQEIDEFERKGLILQ